MTNGFLDHMVATSLERVRRARQTERDGALWERAQSTPPAPPLTLGEFDVFAEVKLRSPAEGALGLADSDRRRQVEAYCDGGAAAVSVLTEPDEFGGSLAHLEEAAGVAAARGRPVMRKDFLTDPYQVLEARAAGAGGVLLVVRVLTDAQLGELLDATVELGMFALVEAFDGDDLDRIGELVDSRAGGHLMVGVNCRDLRTLEVDRTRFSHLAARLPAGVSAVAESGIDTVDAVESVAADGYGVALVGSALMRSGNPSAAVAAFVAAGRAASGGR